MMVEVAFKNAEEALDAGFKEGAEDRQSGFASEDYARSLREEGAKWQRGPGALLYKEWRSAYSAGYRGLEKPAQ